MPHARGSSAEQRWCPSRMEKNGQDMPQAWRIQQQLGRTGPVYPRSYGRTVWMAVSGRAPSRTVNFVGLRTAGTIWTASGPDPMGQAPGRYPFFRPNEVNLAGLNVCGSSCGMAQYPNAVRNVDDSTPNFAASSLELFTRPARWRKERPRGVAAGRRLPLAGGSAAVSIGPRSGEHAPVRWGGTDGGARGRSNTGCGRRTSRTCRSARSRSLR